MNNTPWHQSDNPTTVARGAGWRIGVTVLVVLAVVAVISIGVWGFKVATSDVKGQGDATVQKNSANNRIGAMNRFEDMYAEIEQTDAKIGPAKQAFKANKTQVNQTNLTGLVNYCLDVVGDYNAEARKFTSADFRPVDLPARIDNLNPSTDCK